MRRRRYLAATVAAFAAAGCLGREAPVDSGDNPGTNTATDRAGTQSRPESPTETLETPSPTEPLTGMFETLSDSDWWTVEFDSIDAVYTPGDVYVDSGARLDRIAPDGARHWSVDAAGDPSMLVSGGSTLYHTIGPRHDQALVARDVAAGDQQWTYDTPGRTLAASDTAVFVGEASDDMTAGGQPVFALEADSGEERWKDTIGTHSNAVLAHDLCLVPHWNGTLSAFDVTSGERRWDHDFDVDRWPIGSLQVVGDTAYFVSNYVAASYTLPNGHERWRREIHPKQRSIAAAPAGADRTDTICTGSYEGTLHGFDAGTGDRTWAIDTPGEHRISVIGRGETTVVVQPNELLVGYHAASGEERWRQELTGSGGRPPRVIDGTVVLLTPTGDEEWVVRTFDAESGRRKWRHAVDGGLAGYGVARGRFVVGTEDGDLYGFGPV